MVWITIHPRTPLDRARRVVLGTRLEHLEHVPGRIWAAFNESDNDYFIGQESGSEMEDGESQTSEDDNEINLENLELDDDSTRKRSYVTIDEQLLGFRGKCPFRQFIPKKPDKYGLKFWLCVDVESYYVFNAFLYIGRQSDQKRQQHVGANVVLELLKPLYGSNGNVTIDNLFTSVSLAKELQKKNFTLIETL
ncbi:unnamed protein product [Rotaria sordida]|uniref:PiggyBac transposable element-derived protein domain-containing protein n=1 Tax=Rotaria sordida TaxID=392033 RepID=A0A819UM90_9BILA|nr:unnamed protein product [Rotaria sordida]